MLSFMGETVMRGMYLIFKRCTIVRLIGFV